LCFHSYLLGIEDKIIVRWTDVVNLEKINNMLSDTIKITTRDKREVSVIYKIKYLNHRNNFNLHLYIIIF